MSPPVKPVPPPVKPVPSPVKPVPAPPTPTHEEVLPPPISEPVLYESVEQKPIFKGGEAERKNYLIEELREAADIHGEIQFSFIVEHDGRVTNIKTWGGRDWANKKVAQVLQRMPKWTAGKHQSRIVSVFVLSKVKFE